MKEETKPVGGMPATAFTALALLFIYFSADLAYPGIKTPGERRKKLKLLKENGYLKEIQDVKDSYPEVTRLYNKAIEEHAQNEFPDGWEKTHDHWGCLCIAYKPGWKAPKNGTYLAGETASCFGAFDSAESLWEETHKALAEIEKNQPEPEYA